MDYPCNLETWPKLPNIFQLLDGSGPSNPPNWKVYFHDFAVATLINYVLNSSPQVRNFDTTDFGGDTKHPTFLEDVQNQTLPKYSFIEPRYGGIDNLRRTTITPRSTFVMVKSWSEQSTTCYAAALIIGPALC